MTEVKVALNRLLVRNMDVKDFAYEGSGRGENHVIGNWRKGNPCYIVAENLPEFFPIVVWKADLVVNLDIYLKRFPCKVLKVQPSSFLLKRKR